MRFSVLGFRIDIRVELQALVHDLKIVDWDVNKMLKSTNNTDMAVYTCSILYEVTGGKKVLNCVSLKLSLAS